MGVMNQTTNRILTGSKIYLFIIIFSLVSCEKEDMSTFDTIVEKYQKTQTVTSKPVVKKKRRLKLRFIHRNREPKTTQSKY